MVLGVPIFKHFRVYCHKSLVKIDNGPKQFLSRIIAPGENYSDSMTLFLVLPHLSTFSDHNLSVYFATRAWSRLTIDQSSFYQ